MNMANKATNIVLMYIKCQSEKENWNIYLLEYKLINLDFAAKVYEEYLIYDEIGMIGSVGGTLGMHHRIAVEHFLSNISFLGMFVGFSISGTVSWILTCIKNIYQL